MLEVNSLCRSGLFLAAVIVLVTAAPHLTIFGGLIRLTSDIFRRSGSLLFHREEVAAHALYVALHEALELFGFEDTSQYLG